ncbi:hypothetical protein F511_42001 [Dorcoceras hygrometricum]|uniref:Uncharacterized protein n=1 Tax=Dorcoceras hygrometricum TaxID=472368 RepID=A0A2Z7C2A5_9LAMI|nr:hypothetical protein F511_42001 [Dorcoceras hygrometricum]
MTFRVMRANLYNQDLGLNPLEKCNADVIVAARSFFSRHADVIITESRFLFASIQQLISSFFALLIPDFYCSSSSSTFLQQTS